MKKSIIIIFPTVVKLELSDHYKFSDWGVVWGLTWEIQH
jgi:hypothetical protein